MRLIDGYGDFDSLEQSIQFLIYEAQQQNATREEIISDFKLLIDEFIAVEPTEEDPVFLLPDVDAEYLDQAEKIWEKIRAPIMLHIVEFYYDEISELHEYSLEQVEEILTAYIAQGIDYYETDLELDKTPERVQGDEGFFTETTKQLNELIKEHGDNRREQT